MNVRAHIFVEGRVQGVFFRYETRVEARKKSVQGWVRNRPDGRVEAIFEGEKGKVDDMIDFCTRGPSGARVTRVEVVWEESSSDYQDFTIR